MSSNLVSNSGSDPWDGGGGIELWSLFDASSLPRVATRVEHETTLLGKLSLLVSRRLSRASRNPFARGIIECHLDITNGPGEEEAERCVGKDGEHDGFSPHCRKPALWHRRRRRRRCRRRCRRRRRMGQVTCDSLVINGRTCLTWWSRVAFVHQMPVLMSTLKRSPHLWKRALAVEAPRDCLSRRSSFPIKVRRATWNSARHIAATREYT